MTECSLCGGDQDTCGCWEVVEEVAMTEAEMVAVRKFMLLMSSCSGTVH